MSDVFYRQCSLRRVDGHVDMSWIPEGFAKKGEYLRIRRNGVWENGWQVVEVYDRESEKALLTHERDYLVQRAASDI